MTNFRFELGQLVIVNDYKKEQIGLIIERISGWQRHDEENSYLLYFQDTDVWPYFPYKFWEHEIKKLEV